MRLSITSTFLMCMNPAQYLYHSLLLGSSCANYTGLCPGQHTVSVRGTSNFCPTVKGSVVQRFQTTANFKFTKIGMRVECAAGTYDLETSHPSTLRCRIGTSSWSSCELVDYCSSTEALLCKTCRLNIVLFMSSSTPSVAIMPPINLFFHTWSGLSMYCYSTSSCYL